MALDNVQNFSKSELASGITSGDTTVTVNDGTQFPDPSVANFNIVLWDNSTYPNPADDTNAEIVRVTAKSTNTLTITRAQESTTAVAHSAGDMAALLLTAKTITDIETELAAKLENVSEDTTPQLGGDLDGQSTYDLNNIINADFEGYLDLAEIAVPANPAAGTIRIFAEDDGGFSTLHFDDASGEDFDLTRDSVIIVRNTTGSTITKGSVVYLNGSNGTLPTVALADATNGTTMPSLGIVVADIANNSNGQILRAGILSGVDTSSYTDGQELFVSTTPGAFTTTEPTGTAVDQQIATVVKGGSIGAGIIFVNVGTENDPTLTQTLSNKTIDADNNTLSNIALGAEATGTLTDLSDVDTDKSKTPADGDVLTFDGTDWNAEAASGGNTLDGAYDEGGAGVGRSITADSGAVDITVPDTSNNAGLVINQNDVTNNPNVLEIINAGSGLDALIQNNGDSFFGPELQLYHNTASPSDSDQIASLSFYGNNSAATKHRFGEIRVNSIDVTDGTEDVKFQFVGPNGNEVMYFNSKENAIASGVFATGNPSVFTSNGDNDLVLQTGNATTGSITITDGANGNINIAPDGTGEAQVSGQKILDESDKTGLDASVVSGTAGTDQNLMEWNADGDAIDSGIAAADVLTNTTPFTKAITIESPTASEDITMFYTDDAITVTQLNAVLNGSATPSVTYTIRHASDRSAAGNEVVTGGSTTTSTTTGDEVTSFNDATVPAGSWVWIETTAQSGTVDQMNVTVEYTRD